MLKGSELDPPPMTSLVTSPMASLALMLVLVVAPVIIHRC